LSKRLTRFIVVALAVVGLDQITKALAVQYLSAGPIELIPGFANLWLAYNRGAAFGSFAGIEQGPWMLIVLSLVALGVVVWILLGSGGKVRLMQLCLGLVAGGAVGNLIDRVRLGVVVDFVDVYVGAWHWPTFNVADSGISIGGAVIAWQLIRGRL
jgi:signal peptidase II